jgi:hypothetical protein
MYISLYSYLCLKVDRKCSGRFALEKPGTKRTDALLLGISNLKAGKMILLIQNMKTITLRIPS